MCDKKVLFQRSTHPYVQLKARGRGEKLSFNQICYTTDCLVGYADKRSIPISHAVHELKDMGAFPHIYKAARKSALEPVGKVVSRLVEQGGKRNL